MTKIWFEKQPQMIGFSIQIAWFWKWLKITKKSQVAIWFPIKSFNVWWELTRLQSRICSLCTTSSCEESPFRLLCFGSTERKHVAMPWINWSPSSFMHVIKSQITRKFQATWATVNFCKGSINSTIFMYIFQVQNFPLHAHKGTKFYFFLPDGLFVCWLLFQSLQWLWH